MDKLDLKHLKEVIKLCRKEGVQSLSIEGLAFTLSPDFKPQRRSKAEKDNQTQTFTEEDTLFWSSTPPGLSDA